MAVKVFEVSMLYMCMKVTIAEYKRLIVLGIPSLATEVRNLSWYVHNHCSLLIFRFSHPNLITLMGVLQRSGYPYMENGSLFHCLHGKVNSTVT